MNKPITKRQFMTRLHAGRYDIVTPRLGADENGEMQELSLHDRIEWAAVIIGALIAWTLLIWALAT